LGVWEVSSLDRLRAIDDAHGLAWNAVESRFHYKNRPGVQVVAVRVSRLQDAVIVPETRRYLGCVSWVEFDDGIDVSNATPVLDDASLLMRVAALRNALA
jgi:hypothetical protein